MTTQRLEQLSEKLTIILVPGLQTAMRITGKAVGVVVFLFGSG